MVVVVVMVLVGATPDADPACLRFNLVIGVLLVWPHLVVGRGALTYPLVDVDAVRGKGPAAQVAWYELGGGRLPRRRVHPVHVHLPAVLPHALRAARQRPALVARQALVLQFPFLQALGLVDEDGRLGKLTSTDVTGDEARLASRLWW